MHVPLVCAVFAICIHLQSMVDQCTACEHELRRANTTETLEYESLPEECGRQPTLQWMDIEELNVKSIVSNVVDWMKKAWNSQVQLKLRILRNEQNGTLVEVRFKDVDPTTDNNTGRTFGLRRRMQLFFMVPISFKLGIIMTLLLVLTAVSLKTLLIGFVILFLLLHHTQGHTKLWGSYKTREVSDSHKNIHIHIHTSPEDHHPYMQSYQEPSQPLIYSA